jgi:hypothetical protein
MLHAARPSRAAGVITCLALLLLGCHEAVAPRAPEPDAAARAAGFDAGAAGGITGRVVWEGDIPAVPVFKAYANRTFAIANQFVGEKPNPNTPHIDAESRGVRHALVYLRGIDPDHARPWDHTAVRVTVQARELKVRQGECTGLIGLVRRGDEVEFVNDDVNYHLLKGRGDAFFSLPLVIAHQPTRRRLSRSGIVELSAGAGQFWMQGYLFVSDHPYGTLTDAHGRFELRGVPAGTYELVLWLPNWNIDRQERDPEVGLVSRVVYAPAMQQRRRIEVSTGLTTDVRFACVATDFAGGLPTRAPAAGQ